MGLMDGTEGRRIDTAWTQWLHLFLCKGHRKKEKKEESRQKSAKWFFFFLRSGELVVSSVLSGTR